MDDKRKQEIRERCSAATPGPWSVEWDWESPDLNEGKYVGYAIGPEITDDDFKIMRDRAINDARLIANARQDIPDLLDALEAAERGLETVEWWAARYREQLAGVPGDTPQQQIEWLLERAGVATKEPVGAVED